MCLIDLRHIKCVCDAASSLQEGVKCECLGEQRRLVLFLDKYMCLTFLGGCRSLFVLIAVLSKSPIVSLSMSGRKPEHVWTEFGINQITWLFICPVAAQMCFPQITVIKMIYLSNKTSLAFPPFLKNIFTYAYMFVFMLFASVNGFTLGRS